MLRCRVGLKWIHELYFGMMMTKAVNLTKKSPNDSGLMTSGHHVGGSSICCGKNQCQSQGNLAKSAIELVNWTFVKQDIQNRMFYVKTDDVLGQIRWKQDVTLFGLAVVMEMVQCSLKQTN